MSAVLKLTAETAQQLMTPDPVAIYEGASIREAAEQMTTCNFSAMPVIDDDRRVVGVVTHTDIVRHVPRGDRAPTLAYDAQSPSGDDDATEGTYSLVEAPRTRVRDIMTPKVFSVWPDTSVHDVVEEMVRRDVRRLFVVDDKGALVGVISAIDVLRAVAIDD